MIFLERSSSFLAVTTGCCSADFALAKKRLTVSLKRDPALSATRVGTGKAELVYVLVADKKLNYERGRSRIAYIGTTQRGMSRIARSVAVRAERILGERGVRSFDARIVTCKPRQKVKTWEILERALLLEFRKEYGEAPLCNSLGTKMKEGDEFRLFRRKRIRTIIEDLS